MLTPFDLILWALALLVAVIALAAIALIVYLAFRAIRPRKKTQDLNVYGGTPDGR